jgi:probable rRNA maturation factor
MSKKNSPVQFHFLYPCTLTNRGALKAFIVSIFKKQSRPLEGLNIVFCADGYLLTLNKQFLQHDFYTDILSFPLTRPHDPLVAEIYISIDRVRENAQNIGATLKEELHRVIFHGILHFCGYRDKSSTDIREMRAMEDKYLKAYFKLNAKSAKRKAMV